MDAAVHRIHEAVDASPVLARQAVMAAAVGAKLISAQYAQCVQYACPGCFGAAWNSMGSLDSNRVAAGQPMGQRARGILL